MTPPFLNGGQRKVPDHITNEWQVTENIAAACVNKVHNIRKTLNELERMGAIECKWDDLNKAIWRIKQGGFVPASELKGEVL